MNANVVGLNGSDFTSEHNEEKRSLVEIVVWSSVFIILMFFSFVGNIMVIACIRTNTRLWEDRGNIFLINLGVTDLGTSSVVMLSSLQSLIVDNWVLGSAWCDIVCAANYTFIIVSMLTMCFVSLDRYVAVVHALHYHSKVTNGRIYALIAYAWFQGACFGAAPVFTRWIEYDYWEVVCAIEWHREHDGALIYVIVAFIVCFLGPGVIMAIAYWKVMKVAKSHNSVQPMGFRDNGKKMNQRFAQKPLNAVPNTDNATYERSTSFSTDTCIADDTNITNKKERSLKTSRRDFFKFFKPNFKIIANETKKFEFFRISDKHATLCSATPEGTDKNRQDVVSLSTQPQSALRQDAPPVHSIASHTDRTSTDEPGIVNHHRMATTFHRMTTTSSRTRRQTLVNYGVSSKAVMSLMIVVVAFFVCMTPFSCTKLYKVIVSSKDALPGYANLTASVFQFCSSAINPLIYGIFRRDFRNAFLKLLKKCFRQRL